MLIRMFLFFAGTWFLVGCTRVDENPVQMQALVCDGATIAPTEYIHVENYRDKNVWAQDAYMSSWQIPSDGCQQTAIENSIGNVLWESKVPIAGELLMLRTTYPHTIKVAISP